MASNTIRLLSVFLLLLPLIGANSLNSAEGRVDLKYEVPAVRDSGVATSALDLLLYLVLVNT